jgi:hypothetical protein
VFPSWLAFRFAAPRGMRRLAMAACWMSPLVRLRDLPEHRALPRRRRRSTFARLWGELPADAWTALASALQADRGEPAAHAARIVDALAHLPAGARFRGSRASTRVEALASRAVARRDWPAVARYARSGRGGWSSAGAARARHARRRRCPRRRCGSAGCWRPMRLALLPIVLRSPGARPAAA